MPENPSINTPVPEVATPCKSKKSIFIYAVLILAMVLGIAGTYLVQQSRISALDKQYKQEKLALEERAAKLDAELTVATTELNSLKSPPPPAACDNGTVFENIEGRYKVCMPLGWVQDTEQNNPGEVVFVPESDKDKNFIYLRYSKDILESALSKYSSDVFVDSADREFTVAGVKGVQVFGSVPVNMKRGITVFTKNAVTHEIVLDNVADSTYEDTVSAYKNMVSSIEFLEQ